MVTGFRCAVGLLTRVPVRARVEEPTALAKAVPWFPVVGALVGLLQAGIYSALTLVLPALPAAALAVTASVLLTGAFHEDGLADTADAVGAWDRDTAHRILKDPTHGTYGVAALALSLIATVACVASLPRAAAVAALPAAHALSRAAAAVLLAARGMGDSGLGSAYARALRPRHAAAASAAGILVGVVSAGPLPALGGGVLAATGALAVARVAVRRIGGVTGDVAGAAQQVAFVLILAGAAAARHGLPWWA